MSYQSVADTAKSWNVSERTVRNYCATGKIPGAILIGKTWNIPQDAKRPERVNKKQPAPRTLLNILQDEMAGHVKGGIYHKIQIDLTYNSNHIEGSCLTHDQTRYIYETNTIGIGNGVVNVDDVVETANHFKCIDMVIRDAKKHHCARTRCPTDERALICIQPKFCQVAGRPAGIPLCL